MNEPKTYFSSDIHFGHRNVIGYCNRPFFSVDEMNEKLIQIWNTTIQPKDLIYFLGDFSLNPKYSREIIPQLNGRKILIHGNHDGTYPHKHNRKHVKMMQQYIKDGWISIHDDLIITLKDGTQVLLHHMPYAPVGTENYKPDLRYLDRRPIDKGMILLHGHVHGRYIKHGRMIDVGIDAHNMQIISEDRVIELIQDKREFIPSLLTNFYRENDTLNHKT